MRASLAALARRPTLAIGLAMLAIWVVTAIGAPWLAPYSPTQSDFQAFLAPPSTSHWFGTDQLGRDIFSRVLHGGISVLALAPAATLLGLVMGAAFGLVAGYFGGAVDEAMMRTLDAVMALPVIVLATVAIAVLGPSLVNLAIVIGAIYAPAVARTVRAATLGEVQKDYVQAARLRGEGLAYILAVEILPNLRGPLIAEGTTRLGYAVFTSATLGFLGFGVQPPASDWGLMVSENQAAMTVAPWAVLFPAAAIAFVVVAVGLVVDGLTERDR